MNCRLLLFLLVLTSSAAAQTQHDGGLWLGMDVNRDLKKGFDVGVEGNLRFASETASLNSAILDFGAKKKWNDYWRTSVTYRASLRPNAFGNDYRDRWALDNRFSYEIDKVTFSYRLRYTLAPGTRSSELDWRASGHALRHRFGIELDLKKKWWLNFNYEFFSEPYRDGRLFFTDGRLKIMAEKQIKKRKSIAFGYQMDRNFTETISPTRHVLVIAYSLDLKKRKKKKEAKNSELD